MTLTKLVKNTIRGMLVLGAVVLITSVSIDATDTFQNSQSALSIFARYATTPGCPVGTIEFDSQGTRLCIDVYEAGVGDDCMVAVPASDIDSAANANDADCLPISKAATEPWRQVTQIQAAQLCARAGKRLPTALEWYQAAAGTPDGATNCNVSGSLAPSGSLPLCRSGIGTFDMIGNVWEFVSGTVDNGQLDGVALPVSGYVSEVMTDGLPRATTDHPDVIYNHDYFWSEATGTYAIMRGGFYGSGSDGGLYSTHTGVLQRFSSVAVGFRCITAL